MKLLFPEVEVTRSLSNVIKAYSIRYNDQEKRTLDVEQRAEEIVRRYIGQSSITSENGGFIEGFPGIATIEEIPEASLAEEAPPEISREDELREEIMMELQQQLQEEAEAILTNARLEAEQIKKKAMQEAEVLKVNLMQQATSDGYQEGRKLAEAELAKEKKRLTQRQSDLEEDFARQVSELEPIFADVLIALLHKLTGHLLENKKGIVSYLFAQAMQNCERSDNYILKVSKEDYEEVEHSKTELMTLFERPVRIEIMIDPLLHKGECLIETDSRVIDCCLGMQLEGLTEDIQLMTMLE